MVERSGFAVRRGVVDATTCDALLASLGSDEVQKSRAGARHLLSCDAVRRLAAESPLHELATEALCCDAVPFRVTLFDKSPDANWAVVWHQDTALPLQHRVDAPEWGPWSTKCGVLYAHAPTAALEQVVAVRLHLDECGADNGPLRVIPGTHRLGVLSDDDVAAIAHRSEAEACLVPKGGALVMRPLLIHASAKSTSERRRRVLHIEYATRRMILPGVELAVA